MSAKQDHLHSIIYSALRYCIRITCTGGEYTGLHQLQSGLEGIIWTALPYSRARQRYENRHHQGDLLGIECEESFELMSRQHLRYIGNLQENLKDQHHTKPPSSKQPILPMNQWTVAGMKLLQSFVSAGIGSHTNFCILVWKRLKAWIWFYARKWEMYGAVVLNPTKAADFLNEFAFWRQHQAEAAPFSTPQCQYVAANQSQTLRDQFLFKRD